MSTDQVVVTGATGLIGSSLCRRLRARGDSLTLLVRNPDKLDGVTPKDRVHRWDATQGPPASSALEGAAAVVHLAGASIGDRRWTAGRKQLLRTSRVAATRGLVEALAGCRRRPGILISASAVGIYGDCEDEELDEASPPGTGFLAELSRDWEKEAQAAHKLGVRVILLRTGVVLSRDGGALPEMQRPFRFFIGGPLGSGEQFVSWIHLEDELRLILYLLDHESLSGPVNAVAPQPTRQRELARQLGNLMGRPALIRAPAWALGLVLGEMAGPLLVQGQRVLPARAQEAGFEFRFARLREALADLVRNDSD